MRLRVIGCSGSFPSPSSPSSCYLVEAVDGEDRTWRILLDLGNGALGPLQNYVRPEQLDGVFLSHLHPDHCVDMCALYVALNYNPAGAPEQRLPVYGPANTFDRLEKAYGEHEHGSLAKSYEVHEYLPDEPIAFGPFTITPRQVLHPVEAYGLRVEADGAVLTYSGDTDACPNLVEAARDADLFLCEASFVEGRDAARGIHLTGRRAGQIATEAGVAQLMLTHLPVWNDPDVVLAQARETFAGPITLAAPGLAHTLP